MKPRKLKDYIPTTPQEWLEYQEHRERWTPKMRLILDKRIKEAFPLTHEDRAILKKAKEKLITSRWKKHV